MGVDTKAILRKGVTIEQIKEAIVLKYGTCEVRQTSIEYFMRFDFFDGTDKRQLSVSFDSSSERDYGISGVLCSLGMFGNSVEIARYLCETFGGYLDENDCDDEGFYPINFHLYEKGTDYTSREQLIHKIISKVGYSNLNTTLAIIDEYIEQNSVG